ncbi:MAG: YicC/YloC family endoribonuclease [Candidatus Omnitrophota bacterium]
MIKGMTGFGCSQIASGEMKAIVEIKSLNHRYLDINFYLPIGFGSIEQSIRQLIQKYIERGRVTVSIKIIDKPSQTIICHKDTIKKHLNYANQLKKEFNLKNDLTLSDIVKLPGVFEIKETLIYPEQIWPSLNKSMTKALIALEKMRKSEGRSLSGDVSDQLQKMSEQIQIILKKSKELLKEKKKKLTAEEYTSYQKSSDINEEISRLKHYIAEVKILLKAKISVGKNVDFIAQEMQRETNTIGSKLQVTAISNAVITLKSKIEKIREQAQNIE